MSAYLVGLSAAPGWPSGARQPKPGGERRAWPACYHHETSNETPTDSIHPTRRAADIRRRQIDLDQVLDTYLDPITLTEWVAIWKNGHLAGDAKWAAYRSHLRNHILPRFGDAPLTKITRQTVKAFVKHRLRAWRERTAG